MKSLLWLSIISGSVNLRHLIQTDNPQLYKTISSPMVAYQNLKGQPRASTRMPILPYSEPAVSWFAYLRRAQSKLNWSLWFTTFFRKIGGKWNGNLRELITHYRWRVLRPTCTLAAGSQWGVLNACVMGWYMLLEITETLWFEIETTLWRWSCGDSLVEVPTSPRYPL